MTKEQYEKMTGPLRKYPQAVKTMASINKALTLLCYVLYPLLLVWLWSIGDGRLLRCILVPGISFVAVSIFRKCFNAPRPYELGIPSLMKKKTKGQSFPSRHVFSAFVIAMTYAYVTPAAAPALFLVSILLAVIRVLGGVHFPKDVLAGAAIGILSGLVGYWMIP